MVTMNMEVPVDIRRIIFIVIVSIKIRVNYFIIFIFSELLELDTPLVSDSKNLTGIIIKEETSDFTEDENHQIKQTCPSSKKMKKHAHKHLPTEEEKCGLNSPAALEKDNFLYKFKKIHIPDEIIQKEILCNANKSPKQTNEKKLSQNLLNSTDNDFIIQRSNLRRKSETHSRPQRISEVCNIFYN